MPLEEPRVEVETGHKQPLSVAEVEVDFVPSGSLHQRVTVIVHLFLRVNVLQQFGVIPPVLVSLNHDGVGLNLFDELLSTLGKHC